MGVGLGVARGGCTEESLDQGEIAAAQALGTPLSAPRALPLLVGLEVAVDDVGEPSLQRSDGFFLGLALGEFSFVEGAAFGGGVAELGDGDQVEGVVEHPIAPRVEPMQFGGSR